MTGPSLPPRISPQDAAAVFALLALLRDPDTDPELADAASALRAMALNPDPPVEAIAAKLRALVESIIRRAPE